MATVKCPNCGAENKVTARNGQECAYCGSLLELPKKSASRSAETDDAPKNDVMFVDIPPERIGQGYLERALKSYLIQRKNVPFDIFEHLSILKTQWVYLPMRRYAGRVSCQWSCTEVVEKERISGYRAIRDSEGKVIRQEAEYETYYEYYPRSGTSRDSFDILVPTASLEDLSNLYPTCRHCYKIVQSSNIIKDASIKKSFDKSVSADITMYTGDTFSTEAKEMKDETESYIESVASRISCENVRGSIENEEYSYRYRLTINGEELYYVPFADIVYAYKDTQYDWTFWLSPDIKWYIDAPKSDESEEIINLKKKIKKTTAGISWGYGTSLTLILALLIVCIVAYLGTAITVGTILSFIIILTGLIPFACKEKQALYPAEDYQRLERVKNYIKCGGLMADLTEPYKAIGIEFSDEESCLKMIELEGKTWDAVYKKIIQHKKKLITRLIYCAIVIAISAIIVPVSTSLYTYISDVYEQFSYNRPAQELSSKNVPITPLVLIETTGEEATEETEIDIREDLDYNTAGETSENVKTDFKDAIYSEMQNIISTLWSDNPNGEYFVSDIDSDGILELWVISGTCSADSEISVYSLDRESNKLTKKSTGYSGAWNCLYYMANDHIIECYGHQGYGEWRKLTISDDEIESEVIFEENLYETGAEDYTHPNNPPVKTCNLADKSLLHSRTYQRNNDWL